MKFLGIVDSELDLVTKQYLDEKIEGLSLGGGNVDNGKLNEILEAVRNINTGNIASSGNGDLTIQDVNSIFKVLGNASNEITINVIDTPTIEEIIDKKTDIFKVGSTSININSIKKPTELLKEQSEAKMRELGIESYNNSEIGNFLFFKNQGKWFFGKNTQYHWYERINEIIDALTPNVEYKYIFIVSSANAYNNVVVMNKNKTFLKHKVSSQYLYIPKKNNSNNINTDYIYIFNNSLNSGNVFFKTFNTKEEFKKAAKEIYCAIYENNIDEIIEYQADNTIFN